MKRSSLTLYLGAWCASIALSFVIGRSLSSSDVGTDLARSANALSAQRQSADALKNAAEPLLSEEADAEPSMAELQSQSTAMTRELLDAAFALPISDPKRSETINNLLKQLAASDPLAALELVNDISSLRDAERARNGILEVWASNEPMAALAWAKTALVDVPTNLRDAQMRAIIRGFAETNPKAAFSYANALSEGSAAEIRLKNRLLGEVIETQIRNGGLAEAQTTIALMPDGSTKDNLQRELVSEWADFDPAGAAAYVLSFGDDASTQMKTALIDRWAQDDPAAAAAWLSNLSTDDPAYARATAQITREWTRYDLTASSEWLNSLPASPELDRAVATYTFRAAEEDPATAMSWAESINNDRTRNRMIQQVAANWKEEDAEGFTEYLDNSDLSNKEREELESAKSWHPRGGRGGPPR